MTRTTIYWQPDAELLSVIGTITERVADMTPVMRKLADILVTESKGNIHSKGQGSWPAMSPHTSRIHGQHELLILSGGLIGSIKPAWGKDFAAAYTRAPHAHLMEYGTKTYSQDGSRVFGYAGQSRGSGRAVRRTADAGKHVPSRPFMYVDPATSEKLGVALLEYVAEIGE